MFLRQKTGHFRPGKHLSQFAAFRVKPVKNRRALCGKGAEASQQTSGIARSSFPSGHGFFSNAEAALRRLPPTLLCHAA